MRGITAIGRRLGFACVALYALAACGDPQALGGRDAGMHPGDFAEGHAAQLRATGHDLAPCYSCHSPTEGPGACNDCHEEGPETCNTCHQAPEGPHRIHQQYQCSTCHAEPATLGTPGHLEDRGDGDVVLTAPDRRPTYTAGTCADTACHAGPGATDPAPMWGGARSGALCQSCHGMPPPEHPQDRCDRCHGEVIDAAGALIPGGPHLDGQVQAVDWTALACDGCHGMAGEPAPATGAHFAHLQAGNSAPVACATCHVVPAEVEAPGHVDGVVGVLNATFQGGTCAETGCHGTDQPAWNGTAPCGTCHGNPPPAHPVGDCGRCHLSAGIAAEHVDGQLDVALLSANNCATCHAGAITPGGSHGAHVRYECVICHVVPGERVATHLDGQSPVVLAAGRFVEGSCADTTCHGIGVPAWGGVLAGCDSCHGNPPAPHPVGDCASCHPAADDPRHVNGTVDLVFRPGCGDCHGNPPADATHQAHAVPDAAAPVACSACHVVPQNVSDPGHIDPGPAEVVLAVGQYAAGQNGAGTCSDTGCHALPGASDPAPAWGDRARRCGDCHGVPPPRHLEGACGTCHPAVADGYDIRDPARHVDGQVEFR